MNLLIPLFEFIAVYLLITFILPALILPNYLIFKSKYKITSKNLKEKIKELNKIKNDEKFIKAAFEFVTTRYHSADPLIFLINLPRLFWHNPNKIIEEKGFAYCHVQNLLLELILTESGRFREDQIKTKITFTIVVHQYLEISLRKKKIELDPYAYNRGIPYGKHLNTLNFLFGSNNLKTPHSLILS